MSTTIRNHYLPQNYLMPWSANEAQIWQLDLRADRHVPRFLGVRDAGVERFLYPQEVEEFLTHRVEVPAWSVLKDLRGRATVTRAELEPLLAYLVSQMARTPAGRDYLKNLSYRWAEDVTDRYQAQDVSLEDEGFDKDRLVSMHRDEIPYAHAHISVPGLRILRNLVWEIWRIGPVGEFITSDNPITQVLDRADGMRSKLAFPLSPKLLLVGGISRSGPPDRARTSSQFGNAVIESKRVSESVAHTVNRNLSEGAHRFLYGESPSALMAALPPMKR